MSNPRNSLPENRAELVIYQTEDGRSRIQVRLEGETVWLTQNLMAELFQTTKQNIGQYPKTSSPRASCVRIQL